MLSIERVCTNPFDVPRIGRGTGNTAGLSLGHPDSCPTDGVHLTMIARGIRNTDIQFFFNRPGRPVNSGRISNIGDGRYSDLAAIPAATDEEVNIFLAERSPSTDVPGIVIASTGDETDPISRSVLTAMCAKDDAGDWRLTAGETDTAECKQSFSLRNAAAWLRAVAALANNRGGYVFFGIADKDAAGTCKVVGLASDEFAKTDIGEIATRLRSAFDPTPGSRRRSSISAARRSESSTSSATRAVQSLQQKTTAGVAKSRRAISFTATLDVPAYRIR